MCITFQNSEKRVYNMLNFLLGQNIFAIFDFEHGWILKIFHHFFLKKSMCICVSTYVYNAWVQVPAEVRPLNFQVQAAANYMIWVLGTWFRFSSRSHSIPKCWTISPPPIKSFLCRISFSSSWKVFSVLKAIEKHSYHLWSICCGSDVSCLCNWRLTETFCTTCQFFLSCIVIWNHLFKFQKNKILPMPN